MLALETTDVPLSTFKLFPQQFTFYLVLHSTSKHFKRHFEGKIDRTVFYVTHGKRGREKVNQLYKRLLPLALIAQRSRGKFYIT
jgi:hypothetical protein